MSVPVLLSARASREARSAFAAWDGEHPIRAGLLTTELRRSLEGLKQFPLLGKRVQRKGIRRLLLVETSFHIYYRWDGSSVEILSLWKATRRPPKL